MTKIFFTPNSKLTFETVRADKQKFGVFLEQLNAKSLSLDFSGVVECDSAGLAFLIDAKKQCLRKGIVLKMVGISQEIQALAKFSGVYNVLSV